MQSTGQGGTQSSQPVQRSASTVCMSFAAPTIASTGQAAMHKAHPMHAVSSMRAPRSGPDSPRARSSGSSGTPSSFESAATVSSPPGGHWLIVALPCAIAWA